MECLYCNRKGFKNIKGLSVHRRYNKKCYNKWFQEKQEEDNKKTKVECLLCGKNLRNISNTHLKTHSITQKQYKILFPNALLFSEGLLEEQNQKREKTIQKRYTKYAKHHRPCRHADLSRYQTARNDKHNRDCLCGEKSQFSRRD